MALSDYEGTLKSYIHDDDKLVSYKWLSKELEIHVNVAKSILEKYWEKHKSKEDIVATYLLMGQLKDDSIRIEVVKGSNLISAKSKFLSIYCEHVYSLQKSLENLELLALSGNGDLSFSAVKSCDNYLRNSEEIDNLRYVGNAKQASNTLNSNDKNSKKKVESPKKKSIEVSKTDEDSKTKNEPAVKEKSSVSKKKENDKDLKKTVEKKEAEDTKEKKTEHDNETKKISAEKKSSANQKASTAKVNNKISKNPVQTKQSGFQSLFGKAQSKPTSKQIKDADKVEDSPDSKIKVNKKEQNTETKFDKKKDSTEIKIHKKKDDKETKLNAKIEEKIVKTAENAKNADSKDGIKIKPKILNNTRGKKRNRSQENNEPTKRKRIIIMESSEDESGKSDNEDIDSTPMEVEEELPKIAKQRSPSPPAKKRENGKLMIRKTIDKTFEDEDGFLVTKRVHTYEEAECSDENVKEVIKESEPQKPKPVETKKKQTTLMNFFKKS